MNNETTSHNNLCKYRKATTVCLFQYYSQVKSLKEVSKLQETSRVQEVECSFQFVGLVKKTLYYHLRWTKNIAYGIRIQLLNYLTKQVTRHPSLEARPSQLNCSFIFIFFHSHVLPPLDSFWRHVHECMSVARIQVYLIFNSRCLQLLL